MYGLLASLPTSPIQFFLSLYLSPNLSCFSTYKRLPCPPNFQHPQFPLSLSLKAITLPFHSPTFVFCTSN